MTPDPRLLLKEKPFISAERLQLSRLLISLSASYCQLSFLLIWSLSGCQLSSLLIGSLSLLLKQTKEVPTHPVFTSSHTHRQTHTDMDPHTSTLLHNLHLLTTADTHSQVHLTLIHKAYIHSLLHTSRHARTTCLAHIPFLYTHLTATQ